MENHLAWQHCVEAEVSPWQQPLKCCNLLLKY
jgi:hypothetical protein